MAFKVKVPMLFIGGAYSKGFQWFSEDSEGVRTAIDLTGFEGMIQVRRKAGAPVLAEWSTANGYLDLTGNRILIFVPEDVTKMYNFSEAEWDLIVWPEGHKELAEVIMFGDIYAEKTKTVVPA